MELHGRRRCRASRTCGDSRMHRQTGNAKARGTHGAANAAQRAQTPSGRWDETQTSPVTPADGESSEVRHTVNMGRFLNSSCTTGSKEFCP